MTDNGFHIEEVGLPVPNPWKRNVRLSAFAFFKNGDAAMATFDGDIWIVTGLAGQLDSVRWQRFASGLHEPIGLEIVDDEIYVFTRNGIIRLHDKDRNGEADFYENFSSVVPQTAETREFANDIVAKPGGGFYLAKAGRLPRLEELPMERSSRYHRMVRVTTSSPPVCGCPISGGIPKPV